MSTMVSLIMPVMNGEKYLEKAINSFLAQEYGAKELVIVDGKSTDKSHEIIDKYARRHKEIVWVKEIDAGLSDAINIGIRHSSGAMIGYLGADDLLYRGILEEVAYSSETLEFDAVYFDSITYTVKASNPHLRKCPYVSFSHENLMQLGTLVGLQNIFFRRHIFDSHQYNPSNKWSMDFELYLELTREKELSALYIERVATINIFDGNITSALGDKQRHEMIGVAKRFRREMEPVFYEKRVPVSVVSFLAYKLFPRSSANRRFRQGSRFWEMREEA